MNAKEILKFSSFLSPPKPTHENIGRGGVMGLLAGGGAGAAAGYAAHKPIGVLIKELLGNGLVQPAAGKAFTGKPIVDFLQKGILGAAMKQKPHSLAGLLGLGGAAALGGAGALAGGGLDWMKNRAAKKQWQGSIPGRVSSFFGKGASEKFALAKAMGAMSRVARPAFKGIGQVGRGMGGMIGQDLGRLGRGMMTPKGLGIGAGLGAAGAGAWALNKGVNNLMKAPTGAFGANGTSNEIANAPTPK